MKKKPLNLLVPLFCLCVVACHKGGSSDGNTGGNNGGDATDTIGQNIVLWGMTPLGGTHNSGTLFKINGNGSGFKTMYSFDASSGTGPQGGLCKASNGKLYGMSYGGGSRNSGTIFSFDPSTNTFKKVFDLGVDLNTLANYGGLPFGSLIAAQDGKLYGSASSVIFSIDPVTDTYTKLYTLSPLVDGTIIWGGKFVQATDTRLYGVAASGGPSALSGGTLFSFDIGTRTLTVLHEFLQNDGYGWNPWGTICQGSDGNFYGMTFLLNGRNDSSGIFYRYNAGTNVFTKIIAFSGANGLAPWWNNAVVRGPGTKLYGTVSLGGANHAGVLFSYDLMGAVYQVEHSFGPGNVDGVAPYGGLFRARGSLFFGMTNTAGPGLGVLGTIFRFNAADKSYKVIHSFALNSTDGYSPSGDLVAQ